MCTEGTCPHVARIGVRVPPFCHDDPTLWFAQLEGQFELSGITKDTTMFHYVSAQLEHHIAREVKDIITNPPAQNRYQTLKTELIRRVSASQEKKLRQLLTHEELGDRRPSQFLRHLQSLAGADVPEEFLRTLWSGRLPTHLQTLVASQAKLALSELADICDQVYDIVPHPTQVSATSPNSIVSDMSRQIRDLSQQIVALQTESRLNNNPRSTQTVTDIVSQSSTVSRDGLRHIHYSTSRQRPAPAPSLQAGSHASAARRKSPPTEVGSSSASCSRPWPHCSARNIAPPHPTTLPAMAW